MTEFTTNIEVFPGYDHRDDPNDNRGAHNLSIRFSLIGDLGAITWGINTGWMKRPLLGAYIQKAGTQRRGRRPGADNLLHDMSPRAGAVSLHSHIQRRDYWFGPDSCDVLGGECYGDAGYLIGDTVMDAMFENGHEGVWAALKDIYADWFAEEAVPS